MLFPELSQTETQMRCHRTSNQNRILIYPHDSVIDDATLLQIIEVAVLDGGDEISGGTTVGT